MPSVVGLFEQRELSARRRVDELREEADRIQAELTVAEREGKECAIARSRVGEVLAPENEPGQDHTQEVHQAVPTAEGRGGTTPQAPEAAKPESRSQVPVWREGLDWSALSVDYQRILQMSELVVASEFLQGMERGNNLELEAPLRRRVTELLG